MGRNQTSGPVSRLIWVNAITRPSGDQEEALCIEPTVVSRSSGSRNPFYGPAPVFRESIAKKCNAALKCTIAAGAQMHHRNLVGDGRRSFPVTRTERRSSPGSVPLWLKRKNACPGEWRVAFF